MVSARPSESRCNSAPDTLGPNAPAGQIVPKPLEPESPKLVPLRETHHSPPPVASRGPMADEEWGDQV